MRPGRAETTPAAAPDETVKLTIGRAAGLVGALALVIAWGSGAGALPDVGLWPDVLIVVLVLFPLTFSVVWLALPLRELRGLFLIAIALGALAWAFSEAGMDNAFNAAKLAAYMLVGFWFMELFEVLWSIAVVAAIIPIVDAFSVWRGPTKVVIEQQPGIFDQISIAFRISGEDATSKIGPPDILFFALFLAAAQRFRLRVAATFFSMLALLGITVAITAPANRGLPALPAVALGFLIPNADRLWQEIRAARGDRTHAPRRR
ncbi:MAG: hypothetical protein FJW96_16415 [Actinobacteria bacterium]|nr:hypothetical protein [Actinomycetota bacterium]